MAINTIILTDTHLSEKNIKTNLSIFKQAINLAKENKLDFVIHAGDIFDSRKGQSDSLLRIFEIILDEFETNNIKLIAIPGNHDKTDYTSMDSYLDPYKHHPAFQLIKDYGIVKQGKFDLYFLPYFLEKDIYSQMLKDLKFTYAKELADKKKKKFLITHVAVDGVKNNDGNLVENNLTDDLFDCFDKVFIGHYHDNQKIKNKFIYIGSSFQHNFGEDLIKGFCVIDDKLNFQIYQTQYPQYLKLYVDVATTSKKEMLSLIDKHSDSDDYVRFILSGKQEDLKVIEQNIFKSKGIDVKFEPDDIVVTDQDLESSIVSFDNNSILNEFENFVKINEVQNKEIGLNYLKKCL